MGIYMRNIRWMEQWVPSWEGIDMLELGNQFIHEAKRRIYSAKPWFQERGCRHTSIDINGNDGALPLDLATPLELEQYDVVTDFGTMEHVANLRVCQENIHNACKPGGFMFHTNPNMNSQKPHGSRYGFSVRFNRGFWQKLAQANGYTLLQIDTFPDWVTRVALQMPLMKRPFQHVI